MICGGISGRIYGRMDVIAKSRKKDVLGAK
jgi:hypothetical protein